MHSETRKTLYHHSNVQLNKPCWGSWLLDLCAELPRPKLPLYKQLKQGTPHSHGSPQISCWHYLELLSGLGVSALMTGVDVNLFFFVFLQLYPSQNIIMHKWLSLFVYLFIFASLEEVIELSRRDRYSWNSCQNLPVPAGHEKGKMGPVLIVKFVCEILTFPLHKDISSFSPFLFSQG